MENHIVSKRTHFLRATRILASAAMLVLAGCAAITRQQLVNEAGQPRAGAVTTHCSGTDWVDNSMIAVLPVPILAFASPTQEINEISSSEVLRRCGPPDRVTNRRVEVDRSWCVPTVLTRVVTLGVWHWCPAEVSWDADVVASVPTAEPAAPAAPTRPETAPPISRRESSEY